MNNPLVSIIIPTYKRPNKLERALNSVINQSYKNIEIIVVDDNNENDLYRKETEYFLNKYKYNDRINYLKHKKNQGGAIARNTGIKNSTGKYITFLDDDDEYLENKIQMQVDKFNNSKYTNLALVYCQINFMDSKGSYRKMRAKMHANGNIEALKRHMIRNLGPTSSLMIKKKVLDDIGYFKNLPTGHEYELILRILINGYDVDYITKPMVNMYYHTDERITTGDKKIKGERLLFTIKKKYFNLLPLKIQKKVKYKHYLDIAKRYLLSGNKKKFKYFLNKTYKLDKFKIKTFINYIGILIDYLKEKNEKD